MHRFCLPGLRKLRKYGQLHVHMHGFGFPGGHGVLAPETAPPRPPVVEVEHFEQSLEERLTENLLRLFGGAQKHRICLAVPGGSWQLLDDTGISLLRPRGLRILRRHRD